MYLIGAVLIASFAAIEVAHVIAGQEVTGMSLIRRPFAAFRKLKRRYKVAAVTTGVCLVLAGSALAFFLLSISGSGSGSTNLPGAGTPLALGGGAFDVDFRNLAGLSPGGTGGGMFVTVDTSVASQISPTTTYNLTTIHIGPPVFASPTNACKNSDLSIPANGLTFTDPTTGIAVPFTAVSDGSGGEIATLGGNDEWTGAQLISTDSSPNVSNSIAQAAITFADDGDQTSCEGAQINVPVTIS